MPVSISCSSVDLFLISLFAASFLFTPVGAVCGSDSALVDIAPTLAISICADGQLDNVSPAIVRVVRAPSTSQTTAAQLSLSRDSVMVQPHWPKAGPNFKVYRSDDILTVRTSKLVVIVDLRFLSIKFLDASATTPFLTEQSHSFAPDTDAASGAASFVASSVWGPLSENEAIYGGGSFQNGVIDFRNVPVNLVQFNTEAIVPFFSSSTGYGILWDSASRSILNAPLPGTPPFLVLSTAFWGLGTGAGAEGKLVSQQTGMYVFYAELCVDYGCSKQAGNAFDSIEVTVSDVNDPSGRVLVVQNWDKLSNLPNTLSGKLLLQQGHTYHVIFSGNVDNGRLFVIEPTRNTFSLSSRHCSFIDYYVTWSGQESLLRPLDSAIRGYRSITGDAPPYALWAYGFWQCKEHYASQAELLNASASFRSFGIPVDNIVQDWHYWGNLGWGPQWDKTLYPDPAGMIAQLHRQNFHFMISVWSRFDNSTTFYSQMRDMNALIGKSDYYDVWNSEARALFFNFSSAAHFSIGADALWLDATEPEGFPHENQLVATGSANELFNSYSLFTSAAISDGLRQFYPKAQGRRVFSLTRSSFAGQQRTGAALWSGDISGSWDAMRRQISASLNYQMSGLPYWSMDTGGFFRPVDQYTSPDYLELLVRWFQFAAFTPLMRVHGGHSNTELWNYPSWTMDAIIKSAIRLRYRLLPFTYSGFLRVYSEQWTMQRAMAFDYGADAECAQLADQFMYGSNFLVAPFLQPGGSRSVYFPQVEGGWIGFNDGVKVASFGRISISMPITEAPLFVRASSIVVMGPELQYTSQLPADPLEIRLYPGTANASFILLEDDGENSDFTQQTQIEFNWFPAARKLSIGTRTGSFAGMLTTRTLRLVAVAPGHGVDVDVTSNPDVTVTYEGMELDISL